jgi:hypothetical protein
MQAFDPEGQPVKVDPKGGGRPEVFGLFSPNIRKPSKEGQPALPASGSLKPG